ncbi:MAG: DsbE family thiol:disulfide interchange protein [Alphaproteobacteria bacterium]
MSEQNSVWRARLTRFVPLAVFALLASALYVGLSLNPKEIPSALIDKPVPQFDLPALVGRDADSGLSTADLHTGDLAIVNVWASWCVPCRVEHPLLKRLAAQSGVPIHGLNYKDRPDNARAFLDELGDPFVRVGVDASGRAGIDWGVYGVPETFIISGEGTILHKHIGPLTDQAIDSILLPFLAEAQGK